MSKLRKEVNELIEDIKKGNKDSFKGLYVKTFNHLKVVAYNYLYDHSDIEDVLNDAYFKVFRYCRSVDLKKDGYNWMCKVVQNLSLDYNKQRGIVVPINRIETNSLFCDIEDSILENSELYKAIKTFNYIDQELIYLRYWEDLTLAQIAARKGMKKPTVNKRLKAAIKKLENILNLK